MLFRMDFYGTHPRFTRGGAPQTNFEGGYDTTLKYLRVLIPKVQIRTTVYTKFALE
jgi:hypothetical protein